MARLLVAGLVALFSALGLFASVVNALMYGLEWQAVGGAVGFMTLLLLAGGVMKGHLWASRTLAAVLLGGALFSFATRHERPFPGEPIGGRAVLLSAMTLALLYRGKERLGRPQNNGMQLTSGS